MDDERGRLSPRHDQVSNIPRLVRLFGGTPLYELQPVLEPMFAERRLTRRMTAAVGLQGGLCIGEGVLMAGTATAGPLVFGFLVGGWVVSQVAQKGLDVFFRIETEEMVTRAFGQFSMATHDKARRRRPDPKDPEHASLKVNGELITIESGFKIHLPHALKESFMMVCSGVAALLAVGLNPIGLGVAAVIGVAGAVTWRSTKRAAEQVAANSAAHNSATARRVKALMDVLRPQTWDMLFRGGPWAQRDARQRLADAVEDENKASRKTSRPMLMAGTLSSVMTTLVTAVMFVATRGDMNLIAPILASSILTLRTLQSVSLIPQNLVGLVPAREGARRLAEFFRSAPTVLEIENPFDMKGLGTGIAVKGVRHSLAQHDGTMKTVLEDVSLHIAPGSVFALVGKNGSGKSTLAGLLERFDDPLVGAIEIDGVDLKALSLDSVSNLISSVPQSPIVYEGLDIRQNIVFGNPDISDARVNAICKATGFDGWLKTAPVGLDSVVGSGQLSGGYKQRLGVARMMAKTGAKVWILDEPTAEIDNPKEFMAAILDAARDDGVTVIVITHDPEVAMLAHRTAVLDEGMVVEIGPTQALRNNANSWLRTMWPQLEPTKRSGNDDGTNGTTGRAPELV